MQKKKLNIDSLSRVLEAGAGQSWQLENRAKTMWKNQFNFGFMNKLMFKDLQLVIEEYGMHKKNFLQQIKLKILQRTYKKRIFKRRYV